VRLRTKLFAAASSLALVGSFAAIGANTASAVSPPGQNVLNDHVTCDTLVGTIKFGTALKLGGNPNVTSNPITIKATLDGCVDPDNINVGIAASTIGGVLTSTFVHGTHCQASGTSAGQPSDPPNTGTGSCHGQWFGDLGAIKAKSTNVGGNLLTGVSATAPCIVGRGITGGPGPLPNTSDPGTPSSTKITACNNGINLNNGTISISVDPGVSTAASLYLMDGPDHLSGEGGSFGTNDCFGLSGKSNGITGPTSVVWKNAKNTGKLFQNAGLTDPAITAFTVTQTSGGEFNAINDSAHPSILPFNGATTYSPGDWVTQGGGIYSTLTSAATFLGSTHTPGGSINNYWAYQGPTSNSDSYGGTYGLFQIGTDAGHGSTSAATQTGAFQGTDSGAAGTFDGATGQSEAALATACLGSSGIKALNFGIGGVHFG